MATLLKTPHGLIVAGWLTLACAPCLACHCDCTRQDGSVTAGTDAKDAADCGRYCLFASSSAGQMLTPRGCPSGPVPPPPVVIDQTNNPAISCSLKTPPTGGVVYHSTTTLNTTPDQKAPDQVITAPGVVIPTNAGWSEPYCLLKTPGRVERCVSDPRHGCELTDTVSVYEWWDNFQSVSPGKNKAFVTVVTPAQPKITGEFEIFSRAGIRSAPEVKTVPGFYSCGGLAPGVKISDFGEKNLVRGEMTLLKPKGQPDSIGESCLSLNSQVKIRYLFCTLDDHNTALVNKGGGGGGLGLCNHTEGEEAQFGCWAKFTKYPNGEIKVCLQAKNYSTHTSFS